MYPVVAAGGAALAGLGARLAPRIASFFPVFASKAAGPSGAALARLRALGHKIGTTSDDVLKWIKADPMNALLYGASALSVGVSLKDIIGDEDSPELTKVANGEMALAELNALIKADSASSALSYLSQTDEARGNLRAKARILRFARAHYGGPERAITAHQMHQAFFELPHGDVIAGYSDGIDRMNVE